MAKTKKSAMAVPKERLLLFVSPRAVEEADFDFVEVAAVHGKQITKAAKSMGVLALGDMLEFNELLGTVKKKPSSKKPSFLTIGWHVWEFTPKVEEISGRLKIDCCDGKWRRPRASDGWPKKFLLPTA